MIWKLTCLFLILMSIMTSQFQSVEGDKDVNYREIKDPFRMGKINVVWRKALLKLTDTKLKSLYTDLMAHDKEQFKLKRLLSDGLDTEGLQEASVRKKFREILSSYDLLSHFDEGAVPEKPIKDKHDTNYENHINKVVFKDKKLAKLWEKAERSGFSQEELKLLKQEFHHHEDKVDEYYSVLEATDGLDGKHRSANFLEPLDENEHMDHMDKSKLPSKKYPDGGLPVVNEIRSKHRDIKDGYDILHKKIAGGPDSKEFSEPRVATLWKVALSANFDPEELESLREEMKHYEKRVQKLQHLQSEYLVKKMNNGDKEHLHTEKDESSLYAEKIKRYERHVDKLHTELETLILNRHNEL